MTIIKKETHLRLKRPPKRYDKVTSITVDLDQYNTVKKAGLNLSLVLRELLKDYLELNFPKEYRIEKIKQKEVENEENN